MSLRRISDLSPVTIYKDTSKIDRTKKMLFEVSYPTTSEANMYTSQALTYEQLSCAILDGIFDWMSSGNGFDLSGNFFFNEYRNSTITNLRKGYQSRLYFKNTYIGGLNSGVKLLDGGTSEVLAKSKIDFKIGTTDIDSQNVNYALVASTAPTYATVSNAGLSTTNVNVGTQLKVGSGTTVTTSGITTSTIGATTHVIVGNLNSSSSSDKTTIVGGTVTAATLNGTAYRAKWADLAEYYIADREYEPGTLVKFGGAYELTEAVDEANAVVTSKPGILLNKDMGISSYDQHQVAIALVGRTPVKVVGKVKKFQNLMLSTIPGIAIASDGSRPTVGKALADKDVDDIGLVECVVKLEL